MISQRHLYGKSIVTRLYRDHEDETILSQIGDETFVIDVGCGEGITLGKLVRRFPEKSLIGIDLSRENVDICRSQRLPAAMGDSYNLSFRDDSVDCCLFMEVLEHLEKPERALKEIHRVLRDNGLLLVLIPNDTAFVVARLLTFKFKEARYDPGHVKRWNPRLIRDELQKHGFRVEKQMSLPFHLWALSLHHLVVARKDGARTS